MLITDLARGDTVPVQIPEGAEEHDWWLTGGRTLDGQLNAQIGNDAGRRTLNLRTLWQD